MRTPTFAIRPTDRQAGPSTSIGPALRRIAKGRRLTGRSYGAIHRLLTTSGATMRPRGYQRKTPAGSADVS